MVLLLPLFLLGCCCFVPPQAQAHDWQHDSSASDISCDAAMVNHSKVVVAAVGDSITVGATCGTWKGGFVKVLADLLEAMHPGKYDVRDCGVCGTDAVRTGHGNLRHRSYWSETNHNTSLLMKPDMVLFMLGTNDADEWGPCANSSVHCGNTKAYYEQDWKDMVNGYINLPSKPSVHTMIPPPYYLPHGFFGNWTCPATCPAFTDNETQATHSARSDLTEDFAEAGLLGRGAPGNKEVAKACVIDCILPKLVPKLTAEVGLAPPLSLFEFFGGVDSRNKTLMPGLHPDCNGYSAIAHYLVKQLFSS
jgi:lysophospholipase L1-like esterase